MSINLSHYLQTTDSNHNTPKVAKSSSRNSFSSQSKSRLKILKSPSKPLLRPRYNKSKDKLSPETKNIAISLNKHKLEEFCVVPLCLKELRFDNNPGHKLECDCKIKKIHYEPYTIHVISDYKLFVSCRSAANDFPALLKHKIHAILSVGVEPNYFPSIKGGYFLIDFDGNSLLKPLQAATRFLNAMLKRGNVLVHCESGNSKSGIILMTYLLKEKKLTYIIALELIRKVRPFFKISEEQEKYIKAYENNKN